MNSQHTENKNNNNEQRKGHHITAKLVRANSKACQATLDPIEGGKYRERLRLLLAFNFLVVRCLAVPGEAALQTSIPAALSTMALPPQNGSSMPICGLRSLDLGYSGLLKKETHKLNSFYKFSLRPFLGESNLI